MTKKKIITKLAKIIRENTGRDFINSIQLTKAFLKNTMLYEETDKIEGFVYEYEPEYSKMGRPYAECMCSTGEIYLKNSKYEKWEIPSSFYEIREQF